MKPIYAYVFKDLKSHLHRIFSSYFREVEGLQDADIKTEYVIKMLEKSIAENATFSLIECEGDVIAAKCPDSFDNTDDAFNALLTMEDMTKVAAFLVKQKQKSFAIREAKQHVENTMYERATPILEKIRVCDYAKDFEEVDFTIRDKEKIVGLYNSRFKDCARRFVIGVCDEYEENGVHHGTLFVDIKANKK